MALERRFLDTGIFVASFSEVDHRRRGLARELIRRALADQHGVISPQVTLEFSAEAIERFDHPMSGVQLHAYLRQVLHPLCQIAWAPELDHEAIDTRERHALSLAEARILTAARRAGCALLLTDSRLAGRSYGPVRAVDPFV